MKNLMILFCIMLTTPLSGGELSPLAKELTGEKAEVTVEKKFDPEDYVNFLKSDNYREKATAIKILGASQEKRYLKVIEPFLHDKDILVVEAAINAFGLTKDEAAVGKLKPLLRSDSREIRNTVIKALFNIGGKKTEDIMIDLLDDASSSVRLKAVQALNAMKSKVAWSRLTRSLCCDPSGEVQKNAAKALAEILNPNSCKELREALGSDDDTTKFYSALALAKMKDSSGMKVLINGLDLEDTSLRSAALDGLACLDNRNLLEPLRKMAHGEKDPEILKKAGSIIKKLEEKYK